MLTCTLKNTLFLALECIFVDKTRMLRCILGVFASLEGTPLGAWIAECMHFYVLLEPCLTECMHFCVLLTPPEDTLASGMSPGEKLTKAVFDAI